MRASNAILCLIVYVPIWRDDVDDLDLSGLKTTKTSKFSPPVPTAQCR